MLRLLSRLVYAVKNPSSIVYFFVGHYKAFIRSQYLKHFNEDQLEEMFKIAASCPKCVDKGFRDCCGCPSTPSIMALKPCDLVAKKKPLIITIRETKQF